MSRTAYINGKVLVGRQFRTGLAVTTRSGLIEKIQPAGADAEDGARIVDLAGDYLLPGFVDVQVNGGGGVLFNDQPTVDGIRAIAEAHRAFGTTTLLPTLISDELDIVDRALTAARQAIDSAVPGVVGVHIEGPFLNSARKGIHDARKLRPLTREIAEGLVPLPKGPTVLTLAPETVEPELIEMLSARGFIVSCGHSEATQAQIKQALEKGLRGFTHLFNAMSQLTPREPGVVGQALADRESWCGIIADGRHVAPESLEIAWRCKGAEKLMLVTDAMPTVGSAERGFELMGKRIMVRDGVCVDSQGTLAGAALDMATAVRNMADFTSCTLADACVMASSAPAAFLGVQDKRGSIAEGLRADLVVMDARRRVKSTIIAGIEAV